MDNKFKLAFDQTLKGGLADKKEVSEYDSKVLAKGVKVEREHTKDKKKALEIAMDHIEEDGDYYNKLEKMEKEASISFAIGFSKIAGGPGSGVSHPNTLPIDFLETSPLMTIGKRQEFMDNNSPAETNIYISYKKLKYKCQEKMVPKKVVRMLVNADDVLKKPIDIIRDEKGDFHVLDGHHRAIVAILLKRHLRANIYTMDNVIKNAADGNIFIDDEKGLKRTKNLERRKNFVLGNVPVTHDYNERTPLITPKGDTARPESFQ